MTKEHATKRRKRKKQPSIYIHLKWRQKIFFFICKKNEKIWKLFNDVEKKAIKIVKLGRNDYKDRRERKEERQKERKKGIN